MKRSSLRLALLALLVCPSIAHAQVVFDQVSGVFRAVVSLSDLPWGGTRIDLKVQNTQGPGESQAIVQSNFFIGGLTLESPSYIDEYGGGGTPEGGATWVGAHIASVWSGTLGGVVSGPIGFYDEQGWSVLVAGCTPLAGKVYSGDRVGYADLYDGYIQTCGPDAYAQFTLDVPHVTGTPGFWAETRSYPALVTPEPASLALLATGLVGFAGVGSLRRSRRAA